jgi:hypothetical protein
MALAAAPAPSRSTSAAAARPRRARARTAGVARVPSTAAAKDIRAAASSLAASWALPRSTRAAGPGSRLAASAA